MFDLENIEKKQNIKFPEVYKKIYKSGLKEMTKRLEIYVDDEVFRIRKFLTAAEINEILEEFFDFFGYDIIPIAETDFDDYICLCYRENTKNPSIIHWNYELALENPEEGISFLYGSINEFLNNEKYL